MQHSYSSVPLDHLGEEDRAQDGTKSSNPYRSPNDPTAPFSSSSLLSGSREDILAAAEEHVRNITLHSPSPSSVSTASDTEHSSHSLGDRPQQHHPRFREDEYVDADDEDEEDEDERQILSPFHDGEWSAMETGRHKGSSLAGVPGQGHPKKVPWICFLLGIGLFFLWVIFVAILVIFEAKSIHTSLPSTSSLNGNTTDSFPGIVDFNFGEVPPPPPPARPVQDPRTGKLRYTLDDYFHGALSPNSEFVNWVKPQSGEDGLLTERGPEGIWLESLSKSSNTQPSSSRRILVRTDELKDERTGKPFMFTSYTISADLSFILFSLPGERVWRHSSKKGYMIFDLKTRRARALSNSGPINGISYATWSPTGHSILFVRDNDLYVNVDLQEERRITWDGSEAIFNGIPDWIYEEEIYESEFTVWWSPDSKHIAYLRLDETKVPVYHYSVYETPGLPVSSYPQEKSIKYPKPGYPNPIASIHIYSLEDTGSPGSGRRVTASTPVQPVNLGTTSFSNEDRLLVEVSWVGPGNVLVRAMNRIQDIARLYLIPVAPSSNGPPQGQMVREERGDVDGGWLDTRKSIRYLPPIPGRRGPGYIDVVIHDGFDHLAYFPALNASVPLYYLTSGPYEVVDDGVLAVDPSDRVWYISTERGSTQRHLYSVGLDGQGKIAHTPNDGGYYDVDMSPHGGWYLLSYQGPDVPYNKLVRASRTPGGGGGGQGPRPWERMLVDNQALRQRLSRYSLPKHRYGTFRTPDGIDLNYVEILPPDFDQGVRQGKRYGVLMNVYGGPKSQMVSQQFKYDFHDALVSEMGTDMIVVIVDGRGTGFKGRSFRSLIRGRLGHYEVMDQVAGGRHWASLPYVNPRRIGIWGWSYGGYMSSKVVEANSGVFAAAMSVAPVTDWHFYDTVYTERYMKTPKLNPKGYQESAVLKMDGFHKTKFLLVHGLADDNVHFQQSAHLVDLLTRARVRNYRVQFFTDSDHSISARGAHSEIYSLLRSFILQAMPPR